MANDLNQCNFIGRLGADPESRYMPSGDAVCNFRIACGWKGKDSEGAEWVPVVTFGKLAEICQEYLLKGSQVFISGRFKTRKWEDKEGNTRYSTEIVADRMQMLGSKPKEREEEGREPEPAAAAPAKRGGGAFDTMDDDIPF
jgi:single-strand DNA-binding protein